MASNITEPKRLVYKWIFLDGFHCNIYSLSDIWRCVSFYKIRSYLEFSNRCSCKTTSCTKIDLSVNPTINHPENKGNTSNTSIPITYECTNYFHRLNHSQYNDQSLGFSFSLLHCANGDLSMTSSGMTSHCMTSRNGVLSLLGLCE